jgi:hypothetical protein
MNDALKEAMKNKDTPRRDVIRLALSAIKQVEIDTQGEVTAEKALDILQKEAKKRRESVDEAIKSGREDIADQEKFELSVLEEFLPRQLSREEVEAIVREVIADTGAESAKDMNKVMGPVMARVKGVADGRLVNQVVKDLLGG